MIRWRPFWSYQIEKTEHWLEHMATSGYELDSFYRICNIFSFKQQSNANRFQILYEKSKQTISSSLQQQGWTTATQKGAWRILKNEQKAPAIYPSRVGILSRNRLHTYAWMLFVWTFVVQLITIAAMLAIALALGRESSLQTLIFSLVGGAVLLSLCMKIYRSLREFEEKYFAIAIDHEEPKKKRFKKCKLGWMYSLDTLMDWLEAMSAKGYHLDSINGVFFNFSVGSPKNVVYEYEYQNKVDPTYYSIYKDMGWKLKHTTFVSITNYTIWAKSYIEGEEKPRLTYIKEEMQKQLQSVFKTHMILAMSMCVIHAFVLLLNLYISIHENETFFCSESILLMIVSPIPYWIIWRTQQYKKRGTKRIETIQLEM